jgi:hypothetical protein
MVILLQSMVVLWLRVSMQRVEVNLLQSEGMATKGIMGQTVVLLMRM